MLYEFVSAHEFFGIMSVRDKCNEYSKSNAAHERSC